MYTFNQYQRDARGFRMDSANGVYALFNLAAEVGEVLSIEAKGIRDGYKDNYKEALAKELGDVLWHLAAIADDNGMDLEYIAAANIYKLNDRKQRNQIQGSGDFR